MPRFKKINLSGTEYKFIDESKVPLPEQIPNGEYGQILRTNGDGTTRWDNAASQEEIGSAVENWLEENVAGGETIAIDSSLSVSGLAADSKAVGDAIQTVTNMVNNITIDVDETLSQQGEAADAKAVGDRLEALAAAFNYAEIVVNSLALTPNRVEIGSTVTSVQCAYALNKVPNGLSLKIGAASDINILPDPAVANGSFTADNLSLTENTTFLITANDIGSAVHNAHSSNKAATLSFLPKIYYGAAAVPNSVDSAFLLSLTGELAASKAKTFSVTANAGQYIWYAIPTRYGQCSFKVGGFDGGFELESTITHENASGHSETYYVYKSTNHSLGETTVTAQ